MRFFQLFLTLCAAPITMIGAGLAQPIDPALYGALPSVSDAEISPDGNTIAQIQSSDGVRAVAFYDLTGDAAATGIEIGDVSARWLTWLGPDHVMITVSASKDFAWGDGIKPREIWRRIIINRQTGEFSYIFDGANRFDFFLGAAPLHSILPNDPDHILMGHLTPQASYSLYRVNLDSGKEKLAVRGHRGDRYGIRKFSGTVDWVVDAVGAPAVRIDYDVRSEERRFYLPADNAEGWTFASAVPEKEEDELSVDAHGLAGAPHLVHATMEVDGFKGLYVFDVAQGKTVSTAFASTQYDISEAVMDPSSASVIGARYADDYRKTHFLDPELSSLQRRLESAIPNANLEITSWSRDFSKFMIRVTYSDHPDQYFLYDKQKNSLVMTAASYAALDGKVQAKKEKYDYTASDGLRISGYLTIPASAADKQNLPLIVLPHGGPWARDTQSFDWWAFFYAARGYAVYQPNFRGSSGFGAAFKQAGNGEWGRKMQDDLTEGVQKLIADGVADSDRICIVGGSYGGYAALAGATLTPELYACAVSVNGVSNVLQLLADFSGDDPENDYWRKRVGSRFADDESLRQISPLYHVTSATPPTMVIHADHDIVVPIGQSRRMRNALRDKGIENEFVVLEDEDHWLSTGEMRTKMLRKSIEFIDKHIGD